MTANAQLEILRAPALRSLAHGFFTRKGGASSGIFAGLNCGGGSSDQSQAVRINRDRVAEAMALRAGTVRPDELTVSEGRLRIEPFPTAIRSHFALRFGGKDEEAGSASRRKSVQAAFNSPFWPFVLVSTSVGQEGLDFLGWLRESTASVPVVAFVPWSNAQLIEQALALGVCEFIDKPWRNIHLLHVVKRTLEMDSHRKAKTNPDPASNANLEKQTCNDSIPLMTLADAEKVLVKKAMAETDNHVPKAAVLLGLSKAAMYRRLEKHGISKN